MSSEPLSRVVGRNVRRLRKARNAPLEHVADGARFLGLPWSASTVADIEAGRRAPSLGTLLTLVAILNGYDDVTDEVIGLADLFEGDDGEVVALNDALVAELAAVRSAVDGRPFPLDAVFKPDGRWPGEVSDWVREMTRFGLADSRAAKALGLADVDLWVAATQLWGRSLTAERDARAEQGASPQRLGRITRDLIDELRQEVDRLERGGDEDRPSLRGAPPGDEDGREQHGDD